MNFCRHLVAIVLLALALNAHAEVRGLDGLKSVPLEQLSDRSISALGKAALEIRKGEWKHAKTTNFLYHFFDSFIATPVSVEAEFYYRTISKDLDRDTSQWERKCHIFIFEKPEDWRIFQTKTQLDPWTGGIHAGGELFIQRNPQFKWKGHALGHEVAHLVVHRFFGAGVPLWLNEGYAEYSSLRGYASYHRARGFAAKPRSQAIAPADFIPVEQLTSRLSYPGAEKEIGTFYDESEKLVRFMNKESKQKFVAFLDGLSKGNKLETALWKSFGGRYPSLSALEQEFKIYCTKDFGTSLQD